MVLEPKTTTPPLTLGELCLAISEGTLRAENAKSDYILRATDLRRYMRNTQRARINLPQRAQVH